MRQYGGKDASEFWEDIHGHLRDEILEDIAEQDGAWTGLEVLPTVVGRADGPAPPAAQGRRQPLLWAQMNWSGFTSWSYDCGLTMATPSTAEEVQAIVRAASNVRVLGRGHSFPAICDQSAEDGIMMSLLLNMGSVLAIDTDARTV